MKNIILSFIVLSQFFFSQKKDSLKFVEKPKFETKKLIIPQSLMATGTAVLLTEKRDVPVVENKNFLAFGGYFEDYAQFLPHLSVYAFELAGMKPKTLQTILCHSNIGITMNLYVHTTEEQKQKEIDQIADALKVV